MLHPTAAMQFATGAYSERTVNAVRQMNAEQLAELGLQQVAYLTTTDDRVDGRWTYAIHAANGELLAVVDDVADAVDVVCQYDLMLVCVH